LFKSGNKYHKPANQPFSQCTSHLLLTTMYKQMIFYIIWLSNLLIMCVPDEGYYKKAPCALS
jgi:hypothetical protein